MLKISRRIETTGAREENAITQQKSADLWDTQPEEACEDDPVCGD